MNRLQGLKDKGSPALKKQDSVRGADEFGRKGPQFLTMTRADFAAYEYLCRQAEAKEWIEAIIGEKVETDLWKGLGNGVLLCKIVNAIWPGAIPKYHPATSFSFKLIENIDLFLKACKDRGMQKEELFTPIDLFEKKNMPLVLNTLYKMADKVGKEGFVLKWKKVQDVEFTPKEIQEAKKLEGVNMWEKGKTETSKNISEEEQRKRHEAEEKKREEERRAQEELERQRKEQEEAEEEARKKREAELELARKMEQEEQARRKAEEEKRKKEFAELEMLRKKEKEEYEALKKKMENEERERKQAQEEELKRKRMKEEEEEVILQKKFGGKSNLDKIRKMLGELEKIIGGEDGNTSLHIAVERGLEDVVKYLLEEEKVDPNKANGNHDIPLHIASAKENNKIVELLLKNGSNVNTINRDGNTPLHNAAKAGKAEQCRHLISGGAQVNARNLNLDTPLLLATKNAKAEVADVLIKNKADVNAVNKDEDTALHYASEQGAVEIINKLHTAGNLDLNPRNKENATPLHIAAEREHFVVVKRLVELGAEVDTKRNDGWSPLYTAAYNGDLQTSVLLMSKGADVNGANEEGWTPLHAAAAQGHKPVAQAMIQDFHATVNILNEQGTTPLFHAVSAGRRTVADYLVSVGADVDMTKEEGGWRPIHAACYNEFEKLTSFLVEKNANLSAPCKDIKGYTPLQILISTEDPPIKLIKLLVSKGARLNIQNETGGTALHLAVFWGHSEVVELLVNEHASLDIKNERGRTPLDLAGLYGHKKIAQFLSEQSGLPMPEMRNQKRVTKEMGTPNEPPPP